MTTSTRSRTWLLAVLAVVLAACGTTVPTVAPTTGAPTVPPSAAATPSPVATSTAAPVTPSPVALQPRGVEVFQSIESGHWEIAARESNLGPVAMTEILRAMTEFVEVNAVCSGEGTLVVQIGAAPPATEVPGPTSVPLLGTTLTCPDTDGLSYSLAGSAPAGWFPNPNSIPSDPSIKYEVLVGTIVD